MASNDRSTNRTTVTMHDVARRAKVSQSTVSRVLSGGPMAIQVGEDTRRRVLQAVKDLGYQPNLHAGSLRGKKTHMIAIMIADIANPFYHPLVRAVQDVADEQQYDVMVTNSDHKYEREVHFLESVIRRPMDGVIMVPYHLSDDDIDQFMRRTGASVAAVGQHYKHPDIDIIFSDDEGASYQEVCWLHAVKGHSRIAFIGVPERFSAAARRRRAYERAMQDASLVIEPGFEQLGDWTPASGYQAMQRILELPALPSAVFVANDLMAMGAMEAIFQRGLRIPEDIAIAGFDDVPAASWVRPRLTTTAQDTYTMGRLLATSLFERIRGEYGGPGRRIEVPCTFVPRESA